MERMHHCAGRVRVVVAGWGMGVGAGDGARTRNIQLGRLALCQLSYPRSGCAFDYIGWRLHRSAVPRRQHSETSVHRRTDGPTNGQDRRVRRACPADVKSVRRRADLAAAADAHRKGCVMDRTQALEALGLRGDAEWHAIDRAYWTRVRAAQGRAARDGRAASEVETLNEAYATLSPAGARPPQRATPRPPARPLFPDETIRWIGREGGRMSRRWPRRNPEIALMLGASVALALFAPMSGAGAISVGVPLAVVVLAAWAPWRSEPPSAAEAPGRKHARHKRAA